ncbi:MAG: helix-turn-helix domain-containing protein [Candidatus Acidiferrales bacterium]
MRKSNAQPVKTISPGGAGPEILTVQETARLLKLPVSSIYEKSRKRSAHGPTPLPCRRVGKYLRFFKEEVLQWLENLPKNNSRNTGQIAVVALVLLLSALGAMAQKPAPAPWPSRRSEIGAATKPSACRRLRSIRPSALTWFA